MPDHGLTTGDHRTTGTTEQQSPSGLEARIARLEDLHELQQLRARYCQYLDDGRWEELTQLFTEDGAFIGLSTARGHAEMLEFFPSLNETTVTAWWHFSSNETLEVASGEDGEHDTAVGETWLLQPCVVEGEAQIAAGRYEDQMVRCSDNRWRFTERRVRFFFWEPLAEGWDRGRFGWEPAAAAADPRTVERSSS